MSDLTQLRIIGKEKSREIWDRQPTMSLYGRKQAPEVSSDHRDTFVFADERLREYVRTVFGTAHF